MIYYIALNWVYFKQTTQTIVTDPIPYRAKNALTAIDLILSAFFSFKDFRVFPEKIITGSYIMAEIQISVIPGSAETRRRLIPRVLFPVLGVLLALSVFHDLIQGSLIGDDYYLYNPHEWTYVIRSFTGDWFWGERIPTGLYRPISRLCFYLEKLILGEHPGMFHLISLGVHLLASAGVFFLVKRLFQSETAAYASSLLFLVFPSHHEPVFWLCARTDALAGVFCVWSAFFFATAMEREKSRSFYILSFALYILALGAKATATFLPLGLMFLLFTRPFKAKTSPLSPFGLFLNRMKIILPFWAIMGIYIVGHKLMFQGLTGYFSFETGIKKQLGSFVNYIDYLMLPSAVESKQIPEIRKIISVSVFFLLALHELRGRKHPMILLGAVWILMSYVPLVVWDFRWLRVPRFFYLASMGMSFYLVGLAGKILSLRYFRLSSRQIKYATMIVILPVLGYYARSCRFHINSWLASSAVIQETECEFTKIVKVFPQAPEYRFLIQRPGKVGEAFCFNPFAFSHGMNYRLFEGRRRIKSGLTPPPPSGAIVIESPAPGIWKTKIVIRDR